jgi:hypothetical protein
MVLSDINAVDPTVYAQVYPVQIRKKPSQEVQDLKMGIGCLFGFFAFMFFLFLIFPIVTGSNRRVDRPSVIVMLITAPIGYLFFRWGAED